MLVKSKEKLYQVLQAGAWQGLQEIQAQEIENPINRWTGPKRTLQQHQQVLSFFSWSYQETKNEAVVHWYLNTKDGRWEPLVLPQRGVGMTVNVVFDHPNYGPTTERLGQDWELMGTDHHHCSASAFQSGTDHADEKGQEGLHLTIGDLDKDKHSLHARSSFRQTIRPVLLTDWYELPASYQILPLDLQEKALQHLLCIPSNIAFPEWWKENVLRYEPSKVVTVYDTKSSQWPKSDNNYGGSYGWRRLRGELDDFRKKFQMDHHELYSWLVDLQGDEHLMELLKALSWCYSDIDDAVEAVEDEIKSLPDPTDDVLVTDDKGDPVLDENGDYILKTGIDDYDERVTGCYH